MLAGGTEDKERAMSEKLDVSPAVIGIDIGKSSPAVVSASFAYLAVAGPIAPSISLISAGLPLSSADRNAGEANWTAAAIAATRVARTIFTARLPNKTVYGGSLPVPQYD
jgi:hypothetical protein